MESGVLGNLLAPFGRGLLVIVDRKTNLIKETPIIYPYLKWLSPLEELVKPLKEKDVLITN
ncbi:hypothetical protein [Candidatus Phytoplasma bonamiae]|uniref:Uncharacterized protein n=1 Tax=Candidatus Phytoplasma bonamiae TaxID=2982626 RepID=A0ABT9D870_9MOLU|nr:hypothetical protein ['Bonamia sp.' little leaf phytoplasma]MDO8064289.1 hypothetical protein ['Bonamia sp.' little leaf phytoplasma]